MTMGFGIGAAGNTTMGTSNLSNTMNTISVLQPEESSDDGFGELPGESKGPSVRGKGDIDRHKDCFIFRFDKGATHKDHIIPDHELIFKF